MSLETILTSLDEAERHNGRGSLNAALTTITNAMRDLIEHVSSIKSRNVFNIDAGDATAAAIPGLMKSAKEKAVERLSAASAVPIAIIERDIVPLLEEAEAKLVQPETPVAAIEPGEAAAGETVAPVAKTAPTKPATTTKGK
jgi:hypothetical protein